MPDRVPHQISIRFLLFYFQSHAWIDLMKSSFDTKFHLILFDSLLYMCLESLPAPTPQMARGRILLQLLAAGLGIVTLFGIIAGDTFAFFLTMILTFMLYMSWSEFNYMLTLNLFILFVMQTIITYVQIIKLVQYYDIISNRNTAQVVYTIVKFVYFPTGTFFTHQAYKRFKQYAFTFAENQAFGDYQMLSFNTANQSQNRSQEYHQANQMNSSRAFTPFSGQGVTIG